MHTSSLARSFSALLWTTECQSSGTEMLNISMLCRNLLSCLYSAFFCFSPSLSLSLCVSVNDVVATKKKKEKKTNKKTMHSPKIDHGAGAQQHGFNRSDAAFEPVPHLIGSFSADASVNRSKSAANANQTDI